MTKTQTRWLLILLALNAIGVIINGSVHLTYLVLAILSKYQYTLP
jgi:hypothetical protein